MLTISTECDTLTLYPQIHNEIFFGINCRKELKTQCFQLKSQFDEFNVNFLRLWDVEKLIEKFSELKLKSV